MSDGSKTKEGVVSGWWKEFIDHETKLLGGIPEVIFGTLVAGNILQFINKDFKENFRAPWVVFFVFYLIFSKLYPGKELDSNSRWVWPLIDAILAFILLFTLRFVTDAIYEDDVEEQLEFTLFKSKFKIPVGIRDISIQIFLILMIIIVLLKKFIRKN